MPLCIEKKLSLSGGIQHYECELISFDDRFGILKYTIDREYHMDGVTLYPDDVTYALYWADRPYTLYVWRLDRRKGALYYFNIADRISLQPDQFVWRDLVVDILVDDARDIRILDEDELPRTLSPELLRYIENAKAHIVSRYREIIREAENILGARAFSR